MTNVDIVLSVLDLAILAWSKLKRIFTTKTILIVALGLAALYQLSRQ